MDSCQGVNESSWKKRTREGLAAKEVGEQLIVDSQSRDLPAICPLQVALTTTTVALSVAPSRLTRLINRRPPASADCLRFTRSLPESAGSWVDFPSSHTTTPLPCFR